MITPQMCRGMYDKRNKCDDYIPILLWNKDQERRAKIEKLKNNIEKIKQRNLDQERRAKIEKLKQNITPKST